MSILDKLLDTVKLTQTEELEITRLSKDIGEPFLIKIKSLTLDEFNEVEEDGKTFNNQNIFTILKATTIEDRELKSLTKKFKVATPIDVVTKLFLPGEISRIYTKILNLSGFGKEENVVSYTPLSQAQKETSELVKK